MWSVCLFSLVIVSSLIYFSNGQALSSMSWGNWNTRPSRDNARSNPNQIANRFLERNTGNNNRLTIDNNRFSRNNNQFSRNNNQFNNNQFSRNNNQFSRNNNQFNNNQFSRNNNQFSRNNNQVSRNNQFSRNNNQFSNQFNNNGNNFNSFSNGAPASRHNQLSGSAMNKLLKFINLHRMSVDAQDMYVMKWSNRLARRAGLRSQTCQLLHRNSTSGESLMVVPQQYTGDKVAEYINKYWIAEKNDFRLGTDCRLTTPNTCAYSQMIWAQSKLMGCASHWCASSQLVVCLFEPAGNGMGLLPYRKGNHCQQCPRDTIRCENQLCDWSPMPGK